MRVSDNQQATDKKYRAIVLLGPPGSGKGTQGRNLGEVPGYWFVSMGEILRSLDTKTQPGRQIQQHLHSGELVPAKLVISVWMQYVGDLSATGFDPHRDVLVLGGLPRNIEQVELLRPHVRVERVIYLACDDESLLSERIRGRDAGRQDDVIRHRFNVYREQTAPLLDHYGGERATKVDATNSPLRVLHEIVESLVTRETSHSMQAAAVTARLADHSENLITPTHKEREL